MNLGPRSPDLKKRGTLLTISGMVAAHRIMPVWGCYVLHLVESFLENALYVLDGRMKCSLPHRSENAAREVSARMSFMLREQSMDEQHKAPCVSHR